MELTNFEKLKVTFDELGVKYKAKEIEQLADLPNRIGKVFDLNPIPCFEVKPQTGGSGNVIFNFGLDGKFIEAMAWE